MHNIIILFKQMCICHFLFLGFRRYFKMWCFLQYQIEQRVLTTAMFLISQNTNKKKYSSCHVWTHSSFAKKDTLLPTVAPLEIIIPNRSASPSVEQEHELVSALTAFKCLSTVCVCISICSPNPALCRALFDLWQLPPGSLILQVACPSAAAEHVS